MNQFLKFEKILKNTIFRVRNNAHTRLLRNDKKIYSNYDKAIKSYHMTKAYKIMKNVSENM